MVQLRVNAYIQEGIRIKDMPEEWLAWKDDIDYGEPMQLNVRLLQVGRLMDLGQMEEAYVALEEIARHRGEMIGLLAKEVVCELIYLDLVTGHNQWADTLYTKEIELYVRQYSALMSSKQRFLCAWALYKEQDREKALAIYENVVQKQTQYLLQGEVKMDIAMMEARQIGKPDVQYDHFRNSPDPVGRSGYPDAGRYIELGRPFLMVAVRTFINQFHYEGVGP